NTLGELKIPARISRAQQGLKRDMGMVREFAGCVERMSFFRSGWDFLLINFVLLQSSKSYNQRIESSSASSS
ncbi:hypothetical protein M422DRAFT_162790, partial [Sphaerobolus stellatus SS14]